MTDINANEAHVETPENQSVSANNKRIAKNTAMLYFRMLITMGVSLYTSRIVLNTLGVEDYGIYSVVGGLVVMFSSINTTMAGAVQRFLNFEMGTGNKERVNRVFNTSVTIHIGIALIIFILVESVGIWFLNSKMNIPHERLGAANWVLQFSLLTFMVNILSVPYNAAIIANEKMKVFAYISILEVSLKLIIVFMLVWFNADKLILYVILLFVVAVLIQLIYGVYSKRNFEECNFKWQWNKYIFKEMTSFAGWNLIGVSSTMARTQGVNIVLNLFYGTVVNAAMGITNQVKGAIESFTNSFLTALSPQIIKSYASGDFTYLMKLVFSGSRYAFYMLLFITLPLLLETEFILNVWLKTVPNYTVIFVQLVLITSIIESLSKTLIYTMFATGKIRNYQIIVGSITILNLPFAILFLYLGYQPYIVMVIAIVIAVISLFVRLTMLRSMVNLRVKDFTTDVIVNVLIVSIISVTIPLLLNYYLDKGTMRFFLTGTVSVLSVSTTIFFVGLSLPEQSFIKEKIKLFLKSKF